MTTEAVPPSVREGGFTLIEVLIAMVILSVGLLGLEALGIGAARSLAFAKRQSEFTVEASAELEGAVQTLRRGTGPVTSYCRRNVGPDSISVVYSNSNPTLPRATVTYHPSASRKPAPQPVVLTAEVYVPGGVSVSGGGCDA